MGLAFEENHIAASRRGQVIRDAGAYDTCADNYNFCRLGRLHFRDDTISGKGNSTMKRLIPLLIGAAAIAGAAIEPADFAGLQWRSAGPDRGGRSIASAGSSARPNEYYFGAVGGGVWKTTDGGTTWKPVTDGQLKSSSVGAIAVAESNPDVVYAGMGETELRGNIMQGDGVYKSIDAGKTWKNIGLRDTQAIARIRVDPKDANTVFVAAFG